MEIEGRKKVQPHFNIAPLIDVVLLLLIFFMLSSQFIIRSGIPITLPGSTTAAPVTEERLSVFVTKDEKIYLNEQLVTLDALGAGLKAALADAGERALTIKADEGVGLGFAVKVMDAAQQAGIEGLIISTRIERHAPR